MPVGRLEERVSDWSVDSRVDRPSRLMKNIALTGTESRNGYRYSEAALRGAASRYENKPVFLDHAGRREGQTARSTRDLVGSIVNAQFDGSRVRGDIRVLDTESGRTFLALADENVPGVGMSHVVLAQRSVDGTIVEKIEDVISVDVVVSPATTTTFQEGSTDVAQGVGISVVEERGESADRLVMRLQELIERVEGVLSRTESAQDGGAAARDEAGGSREAPSPAGLGRDSPDLEALITEAACRNSRSAKSSGNRWRRLMKSPAGRCWRIGASCWSRRGEGASAAWIAATGRGLPKAIRSCGPSAGAECGPISLRPRSRVSLRTILRSFPT